MKWVLSFVYTTAVLCAWPVSAQDSLCKRLGGGDTISTVVKSFLMKMRSDDPDKLGRFWLFRGADGVAREEQLIVDFVQNAMGCDRLYAGRDMAEAHKGMGLSSGDWNRSINLLRSTLDEFKVPSPLQTEVITLVESTRGAIVECDEGGYGCR